MAAGTMNGSQVLGKLPPGQWGAQPSWRQDLASCRILLGGGRRFQKPIMHAKSLRQDAGDSRQDGGAPRPCGYWLYQSTDAAFSRWP